MKRGILIGVLAAASLAGCGGTTTSAADERPFVLPVGSTQWDTSAPAWFHDGTLHVGKDNVTLGEEVDYFVLGATGAYWMNGQTLMFTSAEGDTQQVRDLATARGITVSADRSVLAVVDQSRGPTDDYGTHVMQVAAFDTRTGEELYRTPDQAPDPSEDLADWYEEGEPRLDGVSNERVFFDGLTIDLNDSSTVPAKENSWGGEVYEGYEETLFLEGYRVSVRSKGKRRELDEASASGTARLSPDRSTIFEVEESPNAAVAYDAKSGRQRPIDAGWGHFTLSGWSDTDTFYGIAEDIEDPAGKATRRARQVVTCELPALTCTPASPVIPLDYDDQGYFTPVLMEDTIHSY